MRFRTIRSASARALCVWGCVVVAAHAQALTVALAHAAPGHTGASYRTLGRVESSDRAQLVAPFDGLVVRVEARSGSGVQAGAPLLELRPLTLAARTQAAQAAIASARANLGEKRILAAHQLITAAQLDAAQAQLALARARLGDYQARGRLGHVRAPFAGTVRHVVPLGSRVVRGQILLRIRGSRGLRIEADVPLSEAERLTPGASAKVRAGGQSALAEVYAVAQAANRYGLVAVYLTVPSALKLIPGQVVQVDVRSAPIAHAWLVPRGAVVMRGQKAQVFVYEDGKARGVPVRVRRVGHAQVLVTGDLDADSRLVVSQVAWLRAGTPLNARATGARP